MTLLISNARVPLKQSWSTKTKTSLLRGGRPIQRLREKKNKVWLWLLSSPGTSWVSIHSNKLFSCLKNTARFISIIQNGIKHRWYIIKHIHFFLFFLPEPAASLLRDQWFCPSPFHRRPRLFPLLLQIDTKLSAFRVSWVFFFQYSNSDSIGKRRHTGLQCRSPIF